MVTHRRSRQIICALDGTRFGQVLFGQTLRIEIVHGPHTPRIHNTLVWKTAPLGVGLARGTPCEVETRRGRNEK